MNSNNLFPNHKPEDADLSNVEGYQGHPGQERVKTEKGSEKKSFQDHLKNAKDDLDEKMNSEDNSPRKNNKEPAKSNKVNETKHTKEEDDSENAFKEEIKSNKRKY